MTVLASASDLKPVATRDDAREFARRTLKNLQHIERTRQFSDGVHVVTQLTNSLLGLVIFPWEHEIISPLIGRPLEALTKRGWPAWQIERDPTKAPRKHKCSPTLDDLVYHVRNAAAHRHLKYSSDDSDLLKVELSLADGIPRKIHGSKTFELYWWASINAADLRSWLQCLAEAIDEELS